MAGPPRPGRQLAAERQGPACTLAGGPDRSAEGDRRSNARAVEVELLYDKPYEDRGKVRVTGAFTVESLSPHRVVATDDREAIDDIEAVEGSLPRRPKLPYERDNETDFTQMVLDHLRTAGVQQRDRDDRITFASLAPWPGAYAGAEGRYMEGDAQKRAACAGREASASAIGWKRRVQSYPRRM